MRLICFFLTAFSLHLPLAAQEKEGPLLLDEAGLRAAFVGQTHSGFYAEYLEIYGGQTFVEQYNEGGTLTYVGGDIVTGGAWEINGNRICFTYGAEDFIPGCFVVAKVGECFYSYEAAPEGAEPDLSTRQWWIRSYLHGTTPECARAPSVV